VLKLLRDSCQLTLVGVSICCCTFSLCSMLLFAQQYTSHEDDTSFHKLFWAKLKGSIAACGGRCIFPLHCPVGMVHLVDVYMSTAGHPVQSSQIPLALTWTLIFYDCLLSTTTIQPTRLHNSSLSFTLPCLTLLLFSLFLPLSFFHSCYPSISLLSYIFLSFFYLFSLYM